MSDNLFKAVDQTELPRWIFRGVKASWHAAGTGLHPKAPGQPFQHLFSRGETLNRTRGGPGSGADRIPSTKNAVIAHEFGLLDSGISTSVSAKRAKYYALSMHELAGESNGVVYRIDTELLERFGITAYILSAIALQPRVPEDLEVILVASDFGPLSLGVVAEHYEVHRGYDA